MYALPAQRYIESQGRRSAAERARADQDRRPDGSRESRCAANRSPIAHVVAAVPWFALESLLVGDTAPMAPIVAAASGMASKPIVTVNLWYDRAGDGRRVRRAAGARDAVGLRQAAGVRRGRVAPVAGGVSGADALVGADTATLVALAAREVAAAIPGARERRPEARHRHPREARDVLAGARRTGPARRDDAGRGARFSPATGSKPGFRAQSRVRPLPVTWPPNRQSAIASDQSSICQSLQSSMKSIIIHYGEIALKGKNRPWFVARLVKNIAQATNDLDIADVRVLHGPDRAGPRPGRDLGAGPRPRGARLRHRQLRAGGRAPRSTWTRLPPRSSRTSVRRIPPTFRVSAQARRQALSPELAGDRARSRRPHQGSARTGASNLGNPEFTIRVEALTQRSVLFLRQGARRRAACRSAPAARSPACCRAASIRRSRRGA